MQILVSIYFEIKYCLELLGGQHQLILDFTYLMPIDDP
jgi:hypothetical protein